jgi:hypothetical protein
MSSQINTLQMLLSTSQDLEVFLARTLEFKQISIGALEQVLGRARASAEAVAAELAEKRKIIQETEAALASAAAEAAEAQKEKDAAAAASAPTEAFSFDPNFRWKNQSFTVVSEEDVRQITAAIDGGELCSQLFSVNWHGKHHPSSSAPRKIIRALKSAGGRASFADLDAATDLPAKGSHMLQNYLRELVRQGIVSLV